MKTRFTITQKLIVGFGVLLFATLLNGMFIYSSLNKNQELNDKVITIYNPSSAKLQELESLINNSQMLVKNWVFIEKQSNTPDKKQLIKMHEVDFPKLKEEISAVSQNWDSISKRTIDSLFVIIEEKLFVDHKTVMKSLNSFESYDDFMVIVEVNPMVESGGSIIVTTKNILKSIRELKKTIDNKAKSVNIEMNKSFASFRSIIVSLSIIISLFILIISYLTIRSIVNPILQLKQFLLLMTKGILPKKKMLTNNDEIGDMADALKIYINNMHNTSAFAVEIGNGNYDSSFEALSAQDKLGNALLDMRKNLKEAEKKNQQRIEEDKIRNWITKGLADFGDILRQNSDNMEDLAKNIMTNLTDYLNVNQGAMYILNEIDDKNKFFEMKAAIAYNREKYLKVTFEEKEGLVGRCAFEKLPVYLKEIPQEYIKITSGLGTAEPNFLLLVPLIINEKVLGVIELASFNEIPQYQIDFILTLGENIASTISNVKGNEQTKHLLDESKLRSDELSSQEEELRQNMEELQATQEEAARREMEMENTIHAINNTLGTIEIDTNENIQLANDSILNIINIEPSNLIGKMFREIFAKSEELENEFAEIWTGLHAGESNTMITNFETETEELWLKHTFTPFKDDMGILNKVIDLVVDITERKELEKELEQLKKDCK
jgi:PAS domain S-box-containing protein